MSTLDLQDDPLATGGGDGCYGKRRMFQCQRDHGVFTPLTNVVKLDDFMFVNPGRTDWPWSSLVEEDEASYRRNCQKMSQLFCNFKTQ